MINHNGYNLETISPAGASVQHQESFTAVPLALTISIERLPPPRCS
jgi:hypothetical protein